MLFQAIKFVVICYSNNRKLQQTITKNGLRLPACSCSPLLWELLTFTELWGIQTDRKAKKKRDFMEDKKESIPTLYTEQVQGSKSLELCEF